MPVIPPLRRTLNDLGDLSAFAKDPYSTMARLYERDGSVSRLGAGPVRFTLLLGPEATEFILANTELFSWQRAFAGLVPLAGAGALLVNDGERHRRLRKLVQPAFTARKVTRHIGTVRRHVESVMSTWQVGDVVDVYPAFQQALRDATIESLFGARALRDSAELRGHLQVIHEAIDTNSLVRKVQQLGLPSWKRAVAARESVRKWVAGEIARRRAAEPGEDVLSSLLAAGTDDGSSLTDDEVCDQLISLLEAGAETTSATFAWALYCVLDDRAVLATLGEELAAHGADSLDALPYLDQVVQETLRLYPATVVASRMAATEFTFGGTRFPVGSKLVFSPFHTHRMASLWPEPTRFDPGRWDQARPGYRRPATHEFLPFGGGPHRCVGAAFAVIAVKAALSAVVGASDLWLVSKDATPAGLIGMRPAAGLTVLVRDTHQNQEVQR